MSQKSAKIVGSKPAPPPAPPDARVAVGVVAPALVRVAEDAVGLGRLLERSSAALSPGLRSGWYFRASLR